jgi:ABC-type amino acid transport substrate-binding protein
MGSSKTYMASALARMLAAALIATLLALTVGACGSDDDDGSSTTSSEEPQAQVQPPAGLLKDGTLTLGASLTYPPLGYVEDGRQVGLDPELSDVVAELMGLDKRMLNLNFEALIPGLQAHKYDAIFSSVFITRERAATVDFIPYFQTGQAFVVRKGSSYQPQTQEDLCGHTVAVLKGSFNEGLANDDIRRACKDAGADLEVRSFPTDPEATAEVQAGRADVLFTAREVAVFRAEQEAGAELEVASQRILFPVAVGIAVRKGDTEMGEAFRAAIEELEASGELQTVLDKYGLEPADPATVEASLKS